MMLVTSYSSREGLIYGRFDHNCTVSDLVRQIWGAGQARANSPQVRIDLEQSPTN